MPEFFASIIVALIVLYLAEEILIKKLKAKPELSRKLVHMAHGLAAASWAFFVSYQTIILIESLFFVCVLIAKYAHIFQGLDKVGRRTWGEMFFPLGVIAVALMEPNKWIFAAPILTLALADSAAALVGMNGKRHEYHVFGQRKTIEGSASFWLVSVIIVAGLLMLSPLNFGHGLALVLLVPLAATLLENVGVFGSDNLLVPVFVAVVLIQARL